MEPLRAARTTNAGPPCVVCRHLLEPEAGKCTECSSFQGKPCVVCGQRLPRADRGAPPTRRHRIPWPRKQASRKASDVAPVPRKCTECGSYQSRVRRAMAFSNSTLALLTVLLAVIGVVAPVLSRTLAPTSFEVLGVNSRGTELRVRVINRTDRPVHVLEAGLAGGPLGSAPQPMNVKLDPEGEAVGSDYPFTQRVHTIYLAPDRFLGDKVADESADLELHLRLEPRRFWLPRGSFKRYVHQDDLHHFVNGYLETTGRIP